MLSVERVVGSVVYDGTVRHYTVSAGWERGAMIFLLVKGLGLQAFGYTHPAGGGSGARLICTSEWRAPTLTKKGFAVTSNDARREGRR